MLSGFIVFAQFMLFLMIGAMLFAYHQHFPLAGARPRNDAILPRFIVDHAAARVDRLHRRGDRRGRAVAVDQRDGGDDGQRLLSEAREDAAPTKRRCCALSKRITIFWGIVQLVVALGAQWLDQSVLDAGLSVLSLTTGPVLGAFLVGVLTRRVGAAAMIGGMAVGALVLVSVWWTAAVGWTWYSADRRDRQRAGRPRAEPGGPGRAGAGGGGALA